MRICFLSRRFFPTISGMSVYALNLVRELVAMGHDVTMVSQYYGGASAGVYGGGPPPAVDRIRVIGLESVGEQSRGDFEADIATMVETVLAEHRARPFDVIHAQYGYPTGLAALEVAREIGRPSVVSIQGGDGHWVGSCCATHEAAMHAVLDHADALLIGSISFAREVHDRLGTALDRFTIVPGAVDVSRFRPREDREPGECGTPPVLLFHGRIDRRKGLFELLHAVEGLLSQGRDLRLVVSGIGPDLDELRARVAARPALAAATNITGYADYAAAPDIYRKGDIFISPTYAEGFSNTILEAMASGLAIVSTNTVGVVDCLVHERNGLLAEVRDAKDLERQIARMLDDEALRRRLARAGLDEARRLYSWRAIAMRIVEVYEAVAGTQPHTRWSLPDGPPAPCRFRAEPHLL